MKALSVRQPYAGLIVRGEKIIEMRDWWTDYRGPVLICAGRTAEVSFDDPEEQSWFDAEFPRGVAVGVADLVEVRRFSPMDVEKIGERFVCELVNEPFEPDKLNFNCFAWVFENARTIKPFKVRGHLGLFDVALPERSD